VTCPFLSWPNNGIKRQKWNVKGKVSQQFSKPRWQPRSFPFNCGQKTLLAAGEGGITPLIETDSPPSQQQTTGGGASLSKCQREREREIQPQGLNNRHKDLYTAKTVCYIP